MRQGGDIDALLRPEMMRTMAENRSQRRGDDEHELGDDDDRNRTRLGKAVARHEAHKQRSSIHSGSVVREYREIVMKELGVEDDMPRR